MPSVAVSTFTNKTFLLLENVDNGDRSGRSKWLHLETGDVLRFDMCSRHLMLNGWKWLIEG